jgi:hypothetical protein
LKTYEIEVRKVLSGVVSIDAVDYDEALKIVDDMLDNLDAESVHYTSEHWEIPDLC